jgi:integrase/recombinase XerD
MDRVSNVRSVRVDLPSGRTTWSVVDDTGRAIPEVEQFINTYLPATNASPNTVKSYARHLALFFRWLATCDTDWEALSFEGLCMFVNDLRDGTLRSLTRAGTYRTPTPRSRATAEAVLAAVYGFLHYWRLEGRGPRGLELYQEARRAGRPSHSFLAHVESRRTKFERRVKVRGAKTPSPLVIQFESDYIALCAAARTARDRTLLSAMYDGGLRISQALGLRHGDLDIARKRISVERRLDNANGALSKQQSTFWLPMPERFFEFYAASLVDEQLAKGIDSDYVFVNLQTRDVGRPMSYSNAYQVVSAIGRRAGVSLTPHTLRHTHGTALARAGWSAPQIAKRLGQSAASSADVYIHLADDDITEKYRETFPAEAHLAR